MNEAVYKIPVSTEWHEGRWNAPAVIKIQESEKQNSGERAEIADPKFTRGDYNADLAALAQNSTRHRKSPLGDPKEL